MIKGHMSSVGDGSVELLSGVTQGRNRGCTVTGGRRLGGLIALLPPLTLLPQTPQALRLHLHFTHNS